MHRRIRVAVTGLAAAGAALALAAAPAGAPEAAEHPAPQRTAAVALRADDKPLDEDSSTEGAGATMSLAGTRVPDPLVLDNGDPVDSIDD